METIRLDQHLKHVEAKKLELGMSDGDTEAFRNKGGRRTPEKRLLLQRVEERARAAGVDPVISRYTPLGRISFEEGFPRLLAGFNRTDLIPVRLWVRFESLDIYLRIGARSVGRSMTPCVQIANIETRDDQTGKGMLTRFFAAVREHTDMPLFVEGVSSASLAGSLRRRGFSEINPAAGAPWDFVRTDGQPCAPNAAPADVSRP